MTDTTGYKHLEDQLLRAQRPESIGRLAGGIAHDLNNLLLVIKGYGEAIRSAFESGDELHDCAQEIVKAADCAARLTRQLLAFSRRECMRSRNIDLNKLIIEFENTIRRIMPESIQVALTLAPGLWAVNADPDEIFQVVINLVVNARDAMSTGGVLTVATSNVQPAEPGVTEPVLLSAGRFVCIAVSDTGVGLTAEARRHVFEPFFTTKAEGEGTGLGLSIVYGIAKRHGGNVCVHSEQGRGTTFTVYLPASDGERIGIQGSRENDPGAV